MQISAQTTWITSFLWTSIRTRTPVSHVVWCLFPYHSLCVLLTMMQFGDQTDLLVSRLPPLPSPSLPRPFLSLSLFHSTTSGNQTIGGRCAGAEQKPHQLHLILQSAHYKDSAQPPTPRQIVASAPVSLRVQPALLCSCVLSISLTLFSSPCSPGCSAPAPVSFTASVLPISALPGFSSSASPWLQPPCLDHPWLFPCCLACHWLAFAPC